MVFEYALWFAFSTSNNKAEYEALITGLKLAKELRILELKVFSDSQLILEHVRRELEAWSPSMASYLEKANEIKD